jgi:hypothetical protein
MSMGGLGNGQVTLTTLGIDPDVVTEVLETVGAGAPPSTVAHATNRCLDFVVNGRDVDVHRARLNVRGEFDRAKRFGTENGGRETEHARVDDADCFVGGLLSQVGWRWVRQKSFPKIAPKVGVIPQKSHKRGRIVSAGYCRSGAVNAANYLVES